MLPCGGRAPRGRRFYACRAPVRGLIATAALLVAGCVSITTAPRALLMRDDGTVQVRTLACPRDTARAAETGHAASRGAVPSPAGLDPNAIRIVSWNIHKQSDSGWQRDLRTASTHTDLVLLQETVLDPPLRDLIGDAGLRFVMASSFLMSGIDIGVLTASRVAPVASCTERVVEPVLRIPKSAVITWFALAGREDRLAVVNVHAINFSLTLGAYREQFKAIGDALEHHAGPIILAGDLNTWTAARVEAVHDVTKRLGLTEVRFASDRRSVFFGHELDHIYTRELAIVASSTTEVRSSDHNPVAATLRVAR
jgi:endonuclease/exonuclease/phosphatase (EEP) superfamily protein YafD